MFHISQATLVTILLCMVCGLGSVCWYLFDELKMLRKRLDNLDRYTTQVSDYFQGLDEAEKVQAMFELEEKRRGWFEDRRPD